MTDKYNYWRETQRPTRFFFLDSRIVLFLILVILHLKVWTIILFVSAVIFNIWLESRGLKVMHLHRYIKIYLIGNYIPAKGYKNQRYPVSYGFEIDRM
ncbi:MAG: IcmT/TraK family protein [Paracoccaceae bacterium]|nr:IcmT/TraK family protein [Paracoccaceae bacterium]